MVGNDQPRVHNQMDAELEARNARLEILRRNIEALRIWTERNRD